jgi:hypothetical protein
MWNPEGKDKSDTLPVVTNVCTFIANKRRALQSYKERHAELRDMDRDLYEKFLANVERVTASGMYSGSGKQQVISYWKDDV